MWISEAVFVRWLAVFNLIILAGCSLPESKSREDLENKGSVASFTVEKVEGKVLEAKVENSFGLATTKVFALSACLKDANERKTIGGHKFKISEIDQNLSTDPAGCLSWTENLEFNPLADSRYLKINRTIVGTGLHKGSKKLELAINPWAPEEKIEAVIDLSKQKVPNIAQDPQEVQKILKGQNLKTGEPISRPLWLDDGRMNITEDRMTPGTVNLTADVRVIPSIQVKRTNGDNASRLLTRGKFKAQAMIIHSYYHNDKEIRVVLGQSKVSEFSIVNSSLGMNFKIPVAAIPDRGQLLFGLRTEAIDGPDSMKPFEAVYLMGEYYHNKGSFYLRLHSAVTQDPNFSLERFANIDVQSILADRPKDGYPDDVYRIPKFEVQKLKISHLSTGLDKTSKREVIYKIEACIKNGVDSTDTRSHIFQITRFQPEGKAPPQKIEKIQRRSTTPEPCFNWEESLVIDLNECQHFIKGKIVIENKDLAMHEEIGLIVNPWDPKGDEFGRDMRHVGKDERIVYDCKDRPRRQFKLEQSSLVHRSSDYKVDSTLNLSYVKVYDLRLGAWSLTYNNVAEGRAEAQESLRDGIYLLRSAMVRNRDYDASNTYVSSFEKLVAVKRGEINTRISYTVKDLKAIGNKNTVYFDIHPVKESDLQVSPATGEILPKNPNVKLTDLIDHDTPVDSPVFEGTLLLHTDDMTRNLIPYNDHAMINYFVLGKGDLKSGQENLIPEIIAEGKKQMSVAAEALAKKNTLQYFAKENNLDLITINNKSVNSRLPASLKIPAQDLQTILDSGKISKELAPQLCSFWMKDYFTQINADKGGAIYPNYRASLVADCLHHVLKSPEKFFRVDRHLKVKEIGGVKEGHGYNEGFTFGTGFSVSNNHSKTESTSHSIATKGGLSAKAMDLFSLGMDYSYQMSWNQSNAVSNGNSYSANTNKTINVDAKYFDVTMNKYQLCAVVRLNPDLFMDDDTLYIFKKTNYMNFFSARLNAQEKAQAATRGLLICEDGDRTKPITKSESYYLLNQDGYRQGQDTGNPINRDFFLALRSDNDYARFIHVIKGKTEIPKTTRFSEDIIGHSNALLRVIFQSAAQSAPGMYLLKDEL